MNMQGPKEKEAAYNIKVHIIGKVNISKDLGVGMNKINEMVFNVLYLSYNNKKKLIFFHEKM